MKRSIGLVAAVALMAFAATPAQAQYISFDDGSAGSSIGAFYAASGVTFSNGTWQNPFGCCGIASTAGGYQPSPSNPIVAVFSYAVSFASILGQDVGDAGMTLKAYNAAIGGSLVDQSTFFGTGIGVGTNNTLSVSAANIWRIEFSQAAVTSSGDGMIFDDLRYEKAVVATPEPASMALLATGLVGIAGFARRRRKTA